MAPKQLLALVVLLVAVLAAGHLPAAAPQSSSPSSSFCNMSQEGLTACKPAVTRSSPADPSAACCAALAGADLSCLCSFKNTNPRMMRFLGVDPDLAALLPGKCNIPAPAKC